jgi:hypothetical protein
MNTWNDEIVGGQHFLEIQVYINWKFALKGISSVLKYCKI